MTYRTTLALVLTLAASVTSAAWAGNPKAASEAYNKASEAFARKSYAEAAAGFAVADGLEPNPVALESALKAAILADEPVLGMELVERGASRPPDPRVETQMKRAREVRRARGAALRLVPGRARVLREARRHDPPARQARVGPAGNAAHRGDDRGSGHSTSGGGRGGSRGGLRASGAAATAASGAAGLRAAAAAVGRSHRARET